jgi:hypothetical protein
MLGATIGAEEGRDSRLVFRLADVPCHARDWLLCRIAPTLASRL